MNTHLWVFFIEEVKALDGQIYVIYIGFIHDVTCKIEMLSTLTNKLIVVISVNKNKMGEFIIYSAPSNGWLLALSI